MPVKVYERILQLFEAEGIKAIFGIPDPNFVHMFVAAEKRGWNVVTPHHELAAGFMAEGYAEQYAYTHPGGSTPANPNCQTNGLAGNPACVTPIGFGTGSLWVPQFQAIDSDASARVGVQILKLHPVQIPRRGPQAKRVRRVTARAAVRAAGETVKASVGFHAIAAANLFVIDRTTEKHRCRHP